MLTPEQIEQVARGLTPLQISALRDCCERGSTRTNDSGLVDTLLSGIACAPGSCENGWLVKWFHNHPRSYDDPYISRYEPTPLGLAVNQWLKENSHD